LKIWLCREKTKKNIHKLVCVELVINRMEELNSPRNEPVRYVLDSDLCYSLDFSYKRKLYKMLQASGASMQVVNSTISKINLSLLQDNALQGTGRKIHEYKPDLKTRRWIYLSVAFMVMFFVGILIDLYYVHRLVFGYIGLCFMIAGLLIQLVFICRNGKITKGKEEIKIVHDEEQLAIVKEHVSKILLERNIRLMVYGLKFRLGVDSSFIELVFSESHQFHF
jgi:hypothetical protein